MSVALIIYRGDTSLPAHAEGGESHAPSPPAAPASDSGAMNGGGPKLHINSVAQKLKAKTGSEVAMAAAATLQIYDGKQTFSRAELLDTMKRATMYYNANMSSNLTKIIATLVGSKFNQLSDGVYSLTSDEYQKLAAQLA